MLEITDDYCITVYTAEHVESLLNVDHSVFFVADKGPVIYRSDDDHKYCKQNSCDLPSKLSLFSFIDSVNLNRSHDRNREPEASVGREHISVHKHRSYKD